MTENLVPDISLKEAPGIQELREKLALSGPGDLSDEPAALAMRRRRIVEIPWDDCLKQFGANTAADGTTRPVRRYFERSWRTAWTNGQFDAAKLAGLKVVMAIAIDDPLKKSISDALAALAALRKVLTDNGCPVSAPCPFRSAGFSRFSSWVSSAVSLTGDSAKITAVQAALGTLGTAVSALDTKPVFFQRSENTGQPETILSGLVLLHGSGRAYRVNATAGATLSADDFSDSQKYATAWTSKIDSVDLVFEDPDSVTMAATSLEEIDLRFQYIEPRYQELMALRRVEVEVNQQMTANLKKYVTTALSGIDQRELLDTTRRNLSDAANRAYEVDRKLKLLKQTAGRMGYYLLLGEGIDDEVAPPLAPPSTPTANAPKFPDGTAIPSPQPGMLYTTRNATYTWTPRHKKSLLKLGLDEIGYGFRRLFSNDDTPVDAYVDGPQQSESYTAYDPVDVTGDPVQAKVNALQKSGMKVYVFQKSERGYATASGTTLSSVMAQCEVSEEFRRSCAVLIPVYEQALSGERAVVRYQVYSQPCPGISPDRLPSLCVEESLSFRMCWLGAEIGQLLESLCLAPGEERSITVTRSVQRESSIQTTTSSVFEVSRSDSMELSDEMQRTARRDNEFSANYGQHTNGSLSVPLEGASASLGGGTNFGVTDTLRQFAELVSRVARQSAQTVNQTQRQEVTTSSSKSTATTTTETTTATMANINQGRSLTLLFYALRNRFKTGVYLDNLRFHVTSGVEAIEGSGIYQESVVPLHDVGRMLEILSAVPLPFDIDDAAKKYGFYELILKTVSDLLYREYSSQGATASENDETVAPHVASGESLESRKHHDELPAARVRFAGTLGATTATAGHTVTASETDSDKADATMAESTLRQLVKKLNDDFVIEAISTQPACSKELVVASGGIYLDSCVGAVPSTEPYSEQMRLQEVRMRGAEISERLAEGKYKLAQADRIRSILQGDAAGNAIIELQVDQSHSRVSVRLRFPLPAGEWEFCIDGRPVQGLRSEVDSSLLNVLSVEFQHAEPRLQDADIRGRISLRERQTQMVVPYQPF